MRREWMIRGRPLSYRQLLTTGDMVYNMISHFLANLHTVNVLHLL